MLKRFGHAIEALEGRYIAAEDVNCSPEDVAIINQGTRYVVGMTGPGKSGNPSPFTAWGTFLGIRSVIKHLDKVDYVKGKRIAIQGIGSVGEKLMDFLFWAGAELIIQDIDEQKAKKMGQKYQAEVVSGDEIFQVKCDVFAPCALGGILNQETIPKLQCRAIAGEQQTIN